MALSLPSGKCFSICVLPKNFEDIKNLILIDLIIYNLQNFDFNEAESSSSTMSSKGTKDLSSI